MRHQIRRFHAVTFPDLDVIDPSQYSFNLRPEILDAIDETIWRVLKVGVYARFNEHSLIGKDLILPPLVRDSLDPFFIERVNGRFYPVYKIKFVLIRRA